MELDPTATPSAEGPRHPSGAFSAFTVRDENSDMESFLGVSPDIMGWVLFGWVCGCSGRGSLVDGLVRRRPGGLRAPQGLGGPDSQPDPLG
jgi:hypothetical protein